MLMIRAFLPPSGTKHRMRGGRRQSKFCLRRPRERTLGGVRILLTGSSGLIGRHLQPLLRAGGHEVVRLVRAGAAKPQADGVVFDPTSPDVAVLEAFDAVIH